MSEHKYRITRNIEASIVDWLIVKLAEDEWSCRVELDFSDAYEGTLPCIVINSDDRPDQRLQVGSNQLSNFFTIEFRIFATGEGQRKDLRDWLLDETISGIDYYEYTISNGEVSEKTLSGRISIGEIISNRKELRNTDTTEEIDRHRHLLSFRVRVKES